MDSKERALLYRTLISVLNDEENEEPTEDDKVFRSKAKKQITERDEQYTILLKHFISVTKFRNVLKEGFKWLFLLLIVIFTIILHTQEHDTSGREWASKFKQIASDVVEATNQEGFDVDKKMETYKNMM